MAKISLAQVLAWTGGRLLSGSSHQQRRVTGITDDLWFGQVSTDTRTVGSGDLFLALRGARFDGHEFLAQAIAAGATGLLVDEVSLANPAAYTASSPLAIIVVQDTLKALQTIAAGYRQTLRVPVIAITGSVGKTSTRGMVAACLGAAWQVCQTEANNNNEIGLPKTLLSATAEDQAVILEMGMRGRGEIELLSQIAQPDIALITNIGLAHIERLGSQDEILRAKAEITTGLRPGGLLILNADDPYLRKLGHELQNHFRIAFVSTGSLSDAEQSGLAVYQATRIETTEDAAQFNLQLVPPRPGVRPLPVRIPVPGRHMVSNSLFGLAVADAVGIELPVAISGAAQFANTGNRQRLLATGPILVMDDSYNASPESMHAALETLRAMAGTRRLVAALGGMLELGDYAAVAHHRVGQAAARAGYDVVLALGPQAEDLAAGFAENAAGRKAETFQDQAQLISRLLELLLPGDALLVKGSRGFAMERVTQALAEHYSKGEPCHVE